MALLTPLLLALALPAAATQIGVRVAPCPLGGAPVKVYEKLTSDTFGGFDSDLASYSTTGQYREYAVSTCPDNLFSLYGADMEGLPLDSGLEARLRARLAEVARGLPAPEQIEVWDRYRVAAEMYRVLGRDPLFIADLLLQASWTARDRAVGVFEGLDGPVVARQLLDQGEIELKKPLEPRQRKIVLHNLARVAHRAGYAEERDRYLARFEAVGDLDAAEKDALQRLRRIALEVEPALQDEAIAAFQEGLKAPKVSMDDKIRATYLLADLLRRRGRYHEALALYTRVMVEGQAPLDLREMSGFFAKEITETHPEAAQPAATAAP